MNICHTLVILLVVTFNTQFANVKIKQQKNPHIPKPQHLKRRSRMVKLFLGFYGFVPYILFHFIGKVKRSGCFMKNSSTVLASLSIFQCNSVTRRFMSYV